MGKRVRAIAQATAAAALITAGALVPVTAAQAADPAPTCAADYQVVSVWPGGSQVLLTVTNSGSTTLNGWTVRFTLATGSTILNVFNGANTGTTGAITVANRPFNATLNPHAAALVGIIAVGPVPATAANVSCTSP